MRPTRRRARLLHLTGAEHPLLERRGRRRAHREARRGRCASACAASDCCSTTSRRGSSIAADVARFDTPRRGAARAREHRVRARCARSIPAATLVVCPTEYWGYGDEPYLVELAGALHPEIDLFWTGRAICSPTIDVVGRREVRAGDRPPAAVLGQLPRQRRGDGPRTARRALPRAVAAARRGVARCDRERHGALRVVEDRVRHDRGLPVVATGLRPRGQLGCRAARRRRRGGCRRLPRLRRQRPLVMPQRPRRSARDARRSRTTTSRPSSATTARAVAAVVPLAARLRSSAEHLLSGRCENEALIAEAPPWLESFDLGVRALEIIGDLTAQGRLDEDGPTELAPLLAELRARHRRVFGDVMDMTLDGTLPSDHHTHLTRKQENSMNKTRIDGHSTGADRRRDTEPHRLRRRSGRATTRPSASRWAPPARRRSPSGTPSPSSSRRRTKAGRSS